MSLSAIPPIEFLKSVDSTNSYLLQRTGSYLPFQAVATQSQLAGRGRLGRSWESISGLGLAVSIALPVLARAANAGLHSLLVGSAVLSFVREQGVEQAQMKWPNDILVVGRKISGILCEMTPGGFVVAGIGVNLFHAENQLPIQESTSLAVEGVHVDDVHKFTHDLVKSLVKVWSAAERSNTKWSKFLSPSIGTLGERVTVVETQDHSWDGLAEGLNDDGHLLVRSFQDGILRTVVAADVLHLRQ